jgi:hypothetical protein
MNYNKCEIDRFAKLTINTIEYLSFYVPKRNEGYDAAVYPLCFSGEPSLTAEDWAKGQNKEQIRKDITSIENIFATSDTTFEKRGSILTKSENGSPNNNVSKGNSDELARKVN